MFDKFVSVVTTAFMITALGIALRPGSQAPRVIEATGTAIAKVQSAAFGPK